MVLINRISTMKETFEVPELCCSAVEVNENFNTGFCWSGTKLSPSILKRILRQKSDSDLPVPQICLGQTSSVMAICVGVCAVLQVASICTSVYPAKCQSTAHDKSCAQRGVRG